MEMFSAGKGHILIQKSTCDMQMFTDTDKDCTAAADSGDFNYLKN